MLYDNAATRTYTLTHPCPTTSIIRTAPHPSKHVKTKYFVLALVSAKGGRIAPETYRSLPVQYRIAALEEKKGPGSRGGMVTVEVRRAGGG